MTAAKTPIHVRRRLMQFSMRSLLLAMTVLCIWLGIHAHRVRKQKEAVRAIRESGGWVYYEFQETPGKPGNFDVRLRPALHNWLCAALGDDFFYDAVEVNLVYSTDSGTREENANLSDDALQHLEGLPQLRHLLLCRGQATDRGLQRVGKLNKLERLYMWHASEVTDQGVAHLSKLRNLKSIHLDSSRVTDESLRLLAKLPSLERLALQQNHFTDQGLAYLKGNATIRSLWVGLGDGEITNAAMPYLAEMPNLECLDLQKTQVTLSGLELLGQAKNLKELIIGGTNADASAMQKLFPNCTVR